jgi:hypothetical protein
MGGKGAKDCGNHREEVAITAFATGLGRRLGRLQPMWARRPEKGAAQPREEVGRAAFASGPDLGGEARSN